MSRLKTKKFAVCLVQQKVLNCFSYYSVFSCPLQARLASVLLMSPMYGNRYLFVCTYAIGTYYQIR